VSTVSSGDGTKLFASRDSTWADGFWYRSLDSGRTWASLGRSFTKVATSNTSDELVATQDGWIYTSTDAGKGLTGLDSCG